MNQALNIIGFFNELDNKSIGLLKDLNKRFNCNVKFIISLDNEVVKNKININENILFISKIELLDTISSFYNIEKTFLFKIAESYKPFYKIFLGIYCRKKLNINYCIMTDNDIFIFEAINEIERCVINELPFFIQEIGETFNIPDLYDFVENKLSKKINIIQPNKGNGFNIGFCGIKLEMYDLFNKQNIIQFFQLMTKIDVWWKEQSFVVLLTHAISNKVQHFDDEKYLFLNHNDFRYIFKSKIYHCINSIDKSKVDYYYRNNGPRKLDLFIETIKGVINTFLLFLKRYIASIIYSKNRLVLGGERYRNMLEYLKENYCDRILEIGVWRGNTASFILLSSKNNNIEYHGIDVFEDTTPDLVEQEVSLIADSKNMVFEKLSKISKYINLHKGFSTQVFPYVKSLNKQFDCIWIDGGHSYETVKFDFENYSTLLKKGGIIFIDDYTSDSHLPDVKLFVDNELVTNVKYKVIIHDKFYDTYRGYNYKIASVTFT